MTRTYAVQLDDFNVGSVDRIRLTLSKDGEPWDLSGAEVTFTFEKPDRSTQFDRTATVESAAGGIVYYDTTEDDLDTAGQWTLGVTVEDGAVRKRYPYEISFQVNDQP